MFVTHIQKKEFLPYFFKTGKGQYGEGDKFIGVVVPKQRALAKTIQKIELSEIELLLCDPYHHVRFDIHSSFLQEFVGPEGWDVG